MNKRLTVLVLATTLLSGCATYQWQKHGATQADFNRDSYQCQAEAARTYPTYVVRQQVSQGYTTPAHTNCSGTYGYGSSYATCTTTPGYHVPGYTVTTDVNEGNRNQMAMQCMYSRGYQRVQVK